MSHFPFADFKMFSLSLVFVSKWGSLCTSPILGCWVSWNCRLMFFMKFGEFLVIISSNTFTVSFLGLSLYSSSMVDTVYKSPMLCSFFFNLFFFSTGSIIYLVFNFTDSLCNIESAFQAISSILISFVVLFNSKISIWFFYLLFIWKYFNLIYF